MTNPQPAPATTAKAAPASRLALLDGLRFLAACSVLAYHFTALKTQFWGASTPVVFPQASQVGRYGFLGVELFFFISGFVILMTAWGRDVPGFVASRIARLFPAYWTAVLATGALLLATGTALKDLRLQDVVTNLTMQQMPNGIDNVDGVYWTLWVELRFYLLMAVLIAIGLTRQRILAVAVIWPLIGAFAKSVDQPFVSELLISDWAPFFATGMLLYVVYREGWTLLLGLLVGCELILAVSHAVTYSAVIVRRTGGPADERVVGLVILCSFAAVALVATTRLSKVSWRWATWLGALTYPLYLIHEYWGYFFISKLHDRGSRYAVLAVVVLLVLLMALLINVLVERPLARPIRRTLDRQLRKAPRPWTAEPAVAAPSSASAASASGARTVPDLEKREVSAGR